MKIKMHGLGLPELSTILRRRQQTVESYMSEHGLADWDALERHCEAARLVPPTRPVVEPPSQVESTTESATITTEPYQESATRPKKKSTRNALVVIDAGEGEKKPE